MLERMCGVPFVDWAPADGTGRPARATMCDLSFTGETSGGIFTFAGDPLWMNRRPRTVRVDA